MAKRERGPAIADPKAKSAFLVTCDSYKEKNATREVLNVLHEYCDKLYPETGKVSVDHSDDDGTESRPKKKAGGVSDELAAEIAALKETNSTQSKKKRFWVLDPGCRGLFFVRVMLPEIDIMALTRAIFEDIAANKTAKTRFTVRLIPLQIMCYPSVSELAASAEKLAGPYFHKGVSRRYDIQPKIRSFKGLERLDVIKGLGPAIGPGHTVDLTHPEVRVFVEVAVNNAGITIVTAEDFEKCHKFNLRQLTEPVGETLARKQQSEAAKAAHIGSAPVMPAPASGAVEPSSVGAEVADKSDPAPHPSLEAESDSDDDDDDDDDDGDDDEFEERSANERGKPAVAAPKLPNGKFARTKKDNRSAGTIRKYKNKSRKHAKP